MASETETGTWSEDEMVAIRRHQAGELLSFSTGIGGEMTHGYGALDPNGYWQYPLPFEFLSPEQRAIVSRYAAVTP